MLTMRAAATFLTGARSPDALATMLRAVGIVSTVAPLDQASRDALGIGNLARADLGAGTGSIRVLFAELNAGDDFRDSLQRMARTLAARAPHVLWLVSAIDSRGTSAAIAGWSLRGDARRIASFAWEPDHVVDSDAETLCSLGAVRGNDDVLLQAQYVEVMGRDALTRRFYRALRDQVDALAASAPRSVARDDAREVALLYASRLLFLSFLEAKGWLNGERAFLAGQFDACMRSGGSFHRRVLLPLFLGTLNTPPLRRAPESRAFGTVPFLNGGLFARTPVERRFGRARFPDEPLGAMLGELFQRFRFVAREDSATWSEASVDPEMLGRAFESLMSAGDRRAGGVYYTPHELVERVSEAALSRFPATLTSLRDLRVLDPACGSGAFLVHALERLADARRRLGDAQPLAVIRRDVLARSIFGVDRSPTAVWLCELRLWLSVVIDSDETDPRHVPPLPNLDRNIRVGDAIVGSAFATDLALVAGTNRFLDLRRRYLRATGSRKQHLARMLDREERRRLVAQLDRELAGAQHARAERIAALRARDLFGERPARPADVTRELRRLRDDVRRLRAERRRVVDGGALPFSFGSCFPDVQAAGGFDVVLGNPPWVRLHRIPEHLRAHLRRTYHVYANASWRAGADAARASPGFASQVDLAALFVERSVALLRTGGILSLLLPSKLWRSLAGGGVRQLLRDRTALLQVEDWSESRHAFEAAVYPSLLVTRNDAPASRGPSVVVHGRDARACWQLDEPSQLSLDGSAAAPWILLPRDARRAFDVIRAAGIPLSGSAFGAPRLGVKSGCNVAFLLRVRDVAHDLASVVDADGRTGLVEAALLRPALRGDAVTSWTRSACDECILWTHDENGPLERLPARASAWLRRRRDELAQRSDARNGRRWWSLFRTDAGDASTARVVWADIGRRPRALVMPAGDPAVPLNSCYVLRCADDRDAWALATLLNSPLCAAWLNAVAEPARGGYRRYLGWTIGLLPIPADWPRARLVLADAARADDETLVDAVLRAYGLRRDQVAPLLATFVQ